MHDAISASPPTGARCPEPQVLMKSKLVLNPVAGTDAAPEYLTLINERLRQDGDTLDIVITVAAGDATRAAEQAVRDEYDRVIVAGGDGTLNEVLNGVGAVSGGFAKVTFGLIPLGTGNDFATALGVPDDIDGALQALLDGVPTAVDVGVVNDRFFINVSGGGFIAEVSDAVSPQLKTIAGKLAYLIGGAEVLLNHEPVGARIVAGKPGESAIVRDHTLHAFAVCNSRLIGGGRLIAPDAVIDDGELDVCLIEAMPTMEFLGLLRRVANGEHVHDARVTYFRAAEVTFSFDRVVKVNADGQVLEGDRCHYTVLPRAAKFLLSPARPAPGIGHILSSAWAPPGATGSS